MFTRTTLYLGLMLIVGAMLIALPFAHHEAAANQAQPNQAQPYAEVSKKADRVWRAKCASCHGRDGKGATEQGKKMKVVDMTNAKWQATITDKKIKETLISGISRTQDGVKQEMESFKDKLSDKKMKLVIERIRAFAP